MDQFTEPQRELIKSEIARHRKEAFALGLAEGKKQAGPALIADWLKNAWGSWVMRAGLGAVATAIAADIWPIVAEVLAGKVDPQWLAIGGAIIMALRARSIGK